jgi:integrase
MASIFKRKKGRNEPYTIQYDDQHGKRKTVQGFTDKGLSEELAGKLELEARLRTTGLIDSEVDRLAAHKLLPIEQQLDSFADSLADNSPKHVKLTMWRVRRVVTGCEFKKLADVDGEAVQKYLRGLRAEEDLGHKTYNHYLQALDSFFNWCVASKRLLSNPLIGLERLNTAVDVRHPRRALSGDEVAQLVAAARASGVTFERYTGEQRARVYLMSYMTGLRRKELASLRPKSFALKAKPPTVTVEAACSKHRRKDVLPLHPNLVVMVRAWIKGLGPGDHLFPDLVNKETSTMVKQDLERAGIPYETEDGIADFHASGRHSYITGLLRNGTTLPEAKELARHTDVNMTMRYAHIGIDDQAKAVANLPSAKLNPKPPAEDDGMITSALHGRCKNCSAESHSESRVGNDATRTERENPCGCKGLVADRRQVSSDDTMAGAGIEPARRFPSTGF